MITTKAQPRFAASCPLTCTMHGMHCLQLATDLSVWWVLLKVSDVTTNGVLSAFKKINHTSREGSQIEMQIVIKPFTILCPLATQTLAGVPGATAA